MLRAIFQIEIEKTIIIVFTVQICQKLDQIGTKLFEFLQDANRKELKIRKKYVILQWLHFGMTWHHNRYESCKEVVCEYFVIKDVYFISLHILSMFTNNAPVYRGNGLIPGNIGLVQELLSQWKYSQSCTNFFIMVRRHW